MTNTYSEYSGVSIFAPNGKVNTLDYLNQTTQLGNTAVLAVNEKWGVIIVWHDVVLDPKKKKRSPSSIDSLKYPSSKIHSSTPCFLFTSAGITNDSLLLLKNIQLMNTRELIWKNRKIDPVKMLQDWREECAWRCMVMSDRPYGVSALMITALDKEEGDENQNDKKLVAIELTPTGIMRYPYATSIGMRSNSCKTILESKDVKNLNKSEMIRLCIKAMKNAHYENHKNEFFHRMEGFVMNSKGELEKIYNFEEYNA